MFRASSKMGFGGALGVGFVGFSFRFVLLLLTCFVLRLIPILLKDLGFSRVQKVSDGCADHSKVRWVRTCVDGALQFGQGELALNRYCFL